MCLCGRQTVDHLLIHCDVAYVLGNLIFWTFGIHWVLPRRVADHSFVWRNSFGRHSLGIWNVVPLCLLWILRKERNNHIFQDTIRSKDHLEPLLIQTLFDRSLVWDLTNNNTHKFYRITSIWSIIFCNYIRSQSAHHCEHDIVYFINKFYCLLK